MAHFECFGGPCPLDKIIQEALPPVEESGDVEERLQQEAASAKSNTILMALSLIASAGW